MYLQVMAFGLFMMDNKENSIYKMEQRKRVNIAKIDKILKVMNVLFPVGHASVA